MTDTRADKLLDERARVVAQKVTVEADLWAASFLLHRIHTLMPHLIADSPYNAVHRDTLLEEIREFLDNPRVSPRLPGGGADLQGEGSEAPPPGAAGEVA